MSLLEDLDVLWSLKARSVHLNLILVCLFLEIVELEEVFENW